MSKENENSKESIHFRNAAIKSRLKAHQGMDEHLHAVIKVTQPYSWLILIFFSILILSVVVWSIWGVVPTWVNGSGIMLSENTGIYSAVFQASTKGEVTSVYVANGQEVKKNQTIMAIDNRELREKIRNYEIYYQDIKTKLQELETRSRQEIQGRQDELKRRRTLLNLSLQNDQKYYSFLEEQIVKREEALKKGIITTEQLNSTYRDFYSTRSKIQGTKEQLINIKIQETDFKDKWEERIRELKEDILAQSLELNNMRKQYNTQKVIIAPIDGIITSINKKPGDSIAPGESVANIAKKDYKLDAVIYITAEDGKRIEPGMKALISPTTVKKEEYGSIEGEVTYVSEFPASNESIKSILQNNNLVEKFSKNNPPHEVRVKLFHNPNTYSGFKWSSSEGPKQKITQGAIVSAQVIVKSQAPITLLIPMFKKFIGGQ